MDASRVAVSPAKAASVRQGCTLKLWHKRTTQKPKVHFVEIPRPLKSSSEQPNQRAQSSRSRAKRTMPMARTRKRKRIAKSLRCLSTSRWREQCPVRHVKITLDECHVKTCELQDGHMKITLDGCTG